MNPDDTSTKRSQFLKTCLAFSTKIREHEDELMKLLVSYETHNTAEDEITRSLEVLAGAEAELSPIKVPLENLTIATFFPLNLPLYSLILFGVMPSIFSKNVFIRPPQVMEEILARLWDILEIPKYFPEVSLKIAPRHIFVDLYASESDVIIFTGKYENALDIHKHCPYSLLLYNGSGVNPFLLFSNADVDLAAKKAVEMRCFNSGQDCAGPDAFIVPGSIREEFVKKLVYYLQEINVGNTTDPSTNVGPTVKESYITELSRWLNQDHGKIIYGGKIDTKNHFVYPTIALEKIAERTTDSFHEFSNTPQMLNWKVLSVFLSLKNVVCT